MTSPSHAEYGRVAADRAGSSAATVRQGIVTSTDTTPGSTDLAAIGRIRPDEPGQGEATIRLIVDATVRLVGRGPISLAWHSDQLSIAGGVVSSVVTTNKGWAHLRGECWVTDQGDKWPFRMDLFSARAVDSDALDRVAFRVYDCDADPDIGSPAHRILGSLENGGVRLFGD